MKINLVIITACISIAACQNQDDNKQRLAWVMKDTSKYTTIHWIDSIENIGTVEAGKKAVIKFRFRNSGSAPLYIISAEPGCGCTVADYPKEPVEPGADGIITAIYNATKGSTGSFRKNISVTTNTKGSSGHTIFFYGDIVDKGKDAASAKIDTAELQLIKQKALKKNLLLKPNKN